MDKISRILFPTDFSEHSTYARDFAVQRAKDFGASLLILHVIEDPVYPVDVTPFGFSPIEFSRERRDQVDKMMADVVKEIGDAGIEIRTLVTEGKPFMEIIATAREERIDLIVIGTHGRTGLSHVLLGSVTEKVVRKAPCPVLTVRKPGQEFVHP